MVTLVFTTICNDDFTRPSFCHAVNSTARLRPHHPCSRFGPDQFQEMTANALDAIVLLGDSITQGGWDAGGFSQQLACKAADLYRSLCARTPHFCQFLR